MQHIDPLELKQKIQSGKKFFLLDVREEWEYEEDNIGGENIPLGKIPKRLDELDQLKHSEIICHCRTGRRSHQAAKYLAKQGFEKVYSVQGGLEAYLSLQSTGQD
ncbi:MAG: rhodanese-like domain-containing protein [Cytophagales bacterium]|nr:rhodanese-like domain-containing protein [Cytophagales bacterium]